MEDQVLKQSTQLGLMWVVSYTRAGEAVRVGGETVDAQ